MALSQLFLKKRQQFRHLITASSNYNKNIRNKSENTKKEIRRVLLGDEELIFGIGEREQSKFPYFWLRDHCRCDKCYSKETNQSLFNVVELFGGEKFQVRPKSAFFDEKNDRLKITWKDEHVSEFNVNFLFDESFKQTSGGEKKHWNKREFNEDRLTVRFNDDFFIKNLLERIAKYGVGFVKNVPVSVEDTQVLVNKIGAVKNTLFGGMWQVTHSNNLEHSDTAYSQIGLLPHTDNTYFKDAAGLQVFHMLSARGKGGETLLVDGFNAISHLSKKSYELLTTIPLTSRYLDAKKGYFYSNTDYVIKLTPSGELMQIRYNIFDRDVMARNKEYYRAYVELGALLFDKENAIVVKQLQPGTVIFIDNWRVLHGRMEYSGLRNLCGCYISRDDWTSKARTFNIHV